MTSQQKQRHCANEVFIFNERPYLDKRVKYLIKFKTIDIHTYEFESYKIRLYLTQILKFYLKSTQNLTHISQNNFCQPETKSKSSKKKENECHILINTFNKKLLETKFILNKISAIF